MLILNSRKKKRRMKKKLVIAVQLVENARLKVSKNWRMRQRDNHNLELYLDMQSYSRKEVNETNEK
jgi:hypothetical protein